MALHRQTGRQATDPGSIRGSIGDHLTMHPSFAHVTRFAFCCLLLAGRGLQRERQRLHTDTTHKNVHVRSAHVSWGLNFVKVYLSPKKNNMLTINCSI